MLHSHDHLLVVLSIVVSIVAAYAARALYERIRVARGRGWFAWLIGGAIADGTCTCSMHYTAMAAFHLPVPVEYHVPTVLLSLLVSALGAAAALLVLSRRKVGWPELLAAAVCMGGVGISCMHYLGMASMRLQGTAHYSPGLVILSIALAIVISWMALSLTFPFAEDGPIQASRYHGSAILRGTANPAMHFVAMAAVTFTATDELPDLFLSVPISYIGILAISVVPVMVPVVVLLTAMADRLRKESNLLDELFEQAPQAIALLFADNRVVRVNREFTRLFGFSMQEILGHRLGDLIVPNDSRDEILWPSEQRLDLEIVLQRKDGGRLQVALTCVPVKMPGGQVEIYAIFRDITQTNALHAERDKLLERLRLQIDRLPLAYILLDPQNRVRDWNPAAEKMFGYTKEEALGKSCFELIDPQPDEQIKEVLRRVEAGDMHADSVNTNRTKDGRTITCAWFNTPLVEPSGEFSGVISLAQDITERMAADQALRDSAVRLQTLSRRLLEVQEAERRSLARELHDEVGQLLTGLRLLLKPNGDAIIEAGQSKLDQARTIVDSLLEKVRGLSFDLRPAVLDQLGLIPALLELFESYTKQTGVLVSFKHKDAERRLPTEVETTAYRIVQEAITNVARHAGVGGITVRVWATSALLSVQVEDRGRGFDPEAILAAPRSSGLTGMRERVTLLNGQLTIDSRIGGGTQITAELPLAGASDEDKQ